MIKVFLVNSSFSFQYLNDPLAPEKGNLLESMAEFLEGSAELSSDLYSLASVIYNTHPHSHFPARSRTEDQHVGRCMCVSYKVGLNLSPSEQSDEP